MWPAKPKPKATILSLPNRNVSPRVVHWEWDAQKFAMCYKYRFFTYALCFRCRHNFRLIFHEDELRLAAIKVLRRNERFAKEALIDQAVAEQSQEEECPLS